MTEIQLFTAIKFALDQCFAARGLGSSVQVLRRNQPRDIGLNDKLATVGLTTISQKRFGFVHREDQWIVVAPPGASYMQHTEIQAMEVTVQCDALVPTLPPPSPPAEYSAADICDIAARILQSDQGRWFLRKGPDGQGTNPLGIERVTTIRRPFFTDEKGQFSSSPSFDFTVTYNQVDTYQVPILIDETLKIVPV